MQSTRAWPSRLYLDPPQAVQQVGVHRGLVIAGGVEIHRLRPGAEVMEKREHPLGEGPAKTIAVAPRKTLGYAVASSSLIAIFDDIDDARFASLRVGPEDPKPEKLAWGMVDGTLVLHVLGSDEKVLRHTPPTTAELPFEAVVAIANDERGRLAVAVSANEDDEEYDDDEGDGGELAPGVYISDDGVNWKYRVMQELVGPCDGFFLAVSGDAVAVAYPGSEERKAGIWVSRALDEPLVRVLACEYAAALAFDDAGGLFAVASEEKTETIMRIDVKGDVTTIAVLRGDTGTTPRITSIAWDASRKMLWAASPTAGIVTATAPKAATMLS